MLLRKPNGKLVHNIHNGNFRITPALSGIGTLGAVIIQESSHPTKTPLDIGMSGSIIGLFSAVIVVAVGLTMSIQQNKIV